MFRPPLSHPPSLRQIRRESTYRNVIQVLVPLTSSRSNGYEQELRSRTPGRVSAVFEKSRRLSELERVGFLGTRSVGVAQATSQIVTDTYASHQQPVTSASRGSEYGCWWGCGHLLGNFPLSTVLAVVSACPSETTPLPSSLGEVIRAVLLTCDQCRPPQDHL